jgi:hypothetical protein
VLSRPENSATPGPAHATTPHPSPHGQCPALALAATRGRWVSCDCARARLPRGRCRRPASTPMPLTGSAGSSCMTRRAVTEGHDDRTAVDPVPQPLLEPHAPTVLTARRSASTGQHAFPPRARRNLSRRCILESGRTNRVIRCLHPRLAIPTAVALRVRFLVSRIRRGARPRQRPVRR